MPGFQSTKIFLLNDVLLSGVKKKNFVKQIENTLPWTYGTTDLNEEEILGSF